MEHVWATLWNWSAKYPLTNHPLHYFSLLSIVSTNKAYIAFNTDFISKCFWTNSNSHPQAKSFRDVGNKQTIHPPRWLQGQNNINFIFEQNSATAHEEDNWPWNKTAWIGENNNDFKSDNLSKRERNLPLKGQGEKKNFICLKGLSAWVADFIRWAWCHKRLSKWNQKDSTMLGESIAHILLEMAASTYIICW